MQIVYFQTVKTKIAFKFSIYNFKFQKYVEKFPHSFRHFFLFLTISLMHQNVLIIKSRPIPRTPPIAHNNNWMFAAPTLTVVTVTY